MGHFPNGLSLQALLHYAQIVRNKSFELYDWGTPQRNQEKYNQKTPPKIDLTKITSTPVAMFVGNVDDLGNPVDGQWARDQINQKGNALVHYEEMDAGHLTFIVGKDMSYVDRMITLMNKYNPI